MQIHMEEVNPGPDFLGAGLSPLPSVYGYMSFCFLLAAIAWGTVLWQKRQSYAGVGTQLGNF